MDILAEYHIIRSNNSGVNCSPFIILSIPAQSGVIVMKTLAKAFELLAQLPEDFFDGTRDDLPSQERDAFNEN